MGLVYFGQAANTGSGSSSGGGKYRNTGRALSGIGIDNILGDLPFGET